MTTVIDFGNNNVEVITTHFKDIRENSDVKIDDALTEWDMIKSNLNQANTNINYTIYILLTFVFVCLFIN